MGETFEQALRRLRIDADLSQPQLAQQIPVSQASLSRYEGGKQTPDPLTVQRLDDVLAAGGTLIALAAAQRHAAPVSSAVQQESSLVPRRDMLSLAGGAIAGGFLPSIENSRRFVDSALRMSPSDLDAEEWEHVADEYSRLIGKSVPIDALLPHLLAEFDELRTRIEEASEDLRERLVRVVALFSALIAISLQCAGHPLEAKRYWRTGQRAADSIGDAHLASLVRGRRAVYELYQQSASESILRLADTAIRLSGDRVSPGGMSARAARAQILAKDGHAAAAHEALRDLEKNFDKLPAYILADKSTQWAWPEQRLRFVQSFVHSYAGNMTEANSAQDVALESYLPYSYRNSVQLHFHRAISMISAGDRIGGTRHVLTTLDSIPPDFRADQMIYRPAMLALAAIPDTAARCSAVNDAQRLFVS